MTEFSPNEGARILRNTGNGFESAVILSGTGRWTGAVVADYDQDGQDDVVLLPDDGMPKMFVGDPANSSNYVERAYALGLRSGKTSGGVAADFNNDHDLDLYLGRENSDEFLYRNIRSDGTDLPVVGEQNWVKFNLETLGNCNASLIGTKVTVQSGSMQWRQTVCGGSGRGGQRANELLFGLGAHTGQLSVIVDWPVSSTDTLSISAVNSVYTIVDDAEPTIGGTPRFSYEPYPGGADWIFEWSTTERGTEELDQVVLDFGNYSSGDYCYYGPETTLEWGDTNVEITITPQLQGGWWHKVVWRHQDCLNGETCAFQFTVKSMVANGTRQSGPPISFGEFDACVSRFPNPTQ